jgi:predicted SAM-dependent methyltransferase
MTFLYSLYHRFSLHLMYYYHARWKKKNVFRDMLLSQGNDRWLDMGSSWKVSENFHFADLYPIEEAVPEIKDKYFQFDATVDLTDAQVEQLGAFDLIRMQHVYEHFSPEAAQVALKNCARLLKPGGYLLVSVPDLEIFIERYRHKCGHDSWEFKDWAEKRFGKGAPQSYYFSVFSHSVLWQKHEWCYDYEGLEYGFKQSGLYTDISRIGIYDRWADIPFTHNRPWEDVVIVARKK